MTDQATNQTVAKPVSGWQIYKRLLGYTREYWFAFTIGILGFLIYAMTQLGWAELMEYIVDAVESRDSEARNTIALAIAGIFFIRGIGSFLGAYGIAYVARNVVHTLRVDMFNRMLNFNTSYFDNQSAGHILSKYTYDVEQVAAATSDAFKVVVQEGFTVLGLLTYLFYKNWKLSLLFIAIAPIIGLVVNIASKRLRVVSGRIQDSIGDVTHVASETINGFNVVKTFGGETYEHERFVGVSKNNLRQSLKLVVTNSISTPIVQLLVAISLATLIWLALYPEFFGNTSTGEFLAFITAAALLAKPIRMLTQVNTIIQRGIAGGRSVFELLDVELETDEGKKQVDRVKGELEFQSVSFRYTDHGEEVLKNLSFKIEPGETLALVGRSGSGKSTLVSLIPSFLKASEGTVLLDGLPLSDYQLESLRQQIAIVSQKVTLFNDTVAQNIAYGTLQDASKEDIEAAAVAAHAMEFISEMPDGLDTEVGQDGVQLSGGQRQRIAIARAILKNAPVLILDEATSALDTESERLIQDALTQVVKDRTTIIIAHRLSTVEKADRIIVLDKGAIVEQGSHQELIAKEGVYYQLQQSQFLDQPSFK